MQNYILGGYTRRINDGLYSIDFDPETGRFSDKKLIAELDSPTYVCLNEDKTLLFAIDSDELGGIKVFKRDENSDWQELTSIYDLVSAGCHLSFRDSSQTLYVANYHTGAIDVYKLDGDVMTNIQTIQHFGSGPHKNQDNPHVHYTGLNQDHTLLLTCDLGTDHVTSYSVNDEGLLEEAHTIMLPAGTGPRHLVLSADEKFAYVNGELNSTTNVLSLSEDGEFALLEIYENIPSEEIERSASAAIRLTQDGKFLYVSSRFYNAITVYAISEDGVHLEKIQVIDSGGEIPRDFTLSSNDEYVLVAHQDTDNLVVFKRNAETGQLEKLPEEGHANECVCILEA